MPKAETNTQQHESTLKEAFVVIQRLSRNPSYTLNRIYQETGLTPNRVAQIRDADDFKVFDEFRIKASLLAKIQDFLKKHIEPGELHEKKPEPNGVSSPESGYDKFVKPTKEVFDLMEEIYKKKPNHMEITITVKA